MPKIGVLLAGCGRSDGSEIHESVLTLLALDKAGAEIECMAPDVEQRDVINHITGEAMPERRNVLIEAARIARGAIKEIKAVAVDELDGLIIPGGAGPIKNLSDFAVSGENATVHPDVQQLIERMVEQGKPVGAICIAPVMLVKALQGKAAEVTIGNDVQTARKIETMGGKHHDCTVEMIHVDAQNRLVSTPAYMLGPGIKEVAQGIEALVQKVVAMA